MSKDRYFLKAVVFGGWHEVTFEKFVLAERDAGFRPKYGGPGLATGGFTGHGIQGRILSEGATASSYRADPDFVAIAFPEAVVEEVDFDAELRKLMGEGA
jgi:hypothetical protein